MTKGGGRAVPPAAGMGAGGLWAGVHGKHGEPGRGDGPEWRILAAAQNTGDITACGRFQQVMGKKRRSAGAGQGALRRRSLSRKGDGAGGSVSLRCGGAGGGSPAPMGAGGVYDITAHEHRWERACLPRR